MSAFDELLRKHRKRIIDREKTAFAELLAEYSNLQRTLKRQLAEIQKLIKEKRESGGPIGRSWIYRERRLRALLDQIGGEIERFGRTVSRITTREQRAAVNIAFDQVKETVAATAGQTGSIGTVLPTRAIENAIGLMGDGSPIFDYWASKMAPAVVEKMREQLINAVATGMGLRQLARQLEATGDITRTRALAMARTEVNRVRRESTRQILEENSDVFTGWEWVASKSPRTCAVCLALDGKVFALDKPFPQHINCRCTLIAVIDGVDRPPRQLGSEWFDEQPYEVWEKALGVEGAEAFERGDVTLKDFIGWRTDKHFGKSVYKKPLIKVLAGK